MLHALNNFCNNSQRKQDVMIENLSLKLTFCTIQPSKMHMLKISAIISICVQICETFISLNLNGFQDPDLEKAIPTCLQLWQKLSNLSEVNFSVTSAITYKEKLHSILHVK